MLHVSKQSKVISTQTIYRMLTEGTTVDPEGIPDDLIIISFLNAVADQKCKICSLKLLTSFESVLADAIVDER